MREPALSQFVTHPRRLIDVETLCAKVGGTRKINKATAYRWIAQGWLPRPIKIGPRLVRWVESEVDDAIRQRAEDRDRTA